MQPIGLLSKKRADALYQPLDADLTGLASLSTIGFVKRVGAGTYAAAALLASDIPDLDGAKITTGTVAAARLGVMTGDSGSGGASGAVPAPAAGDATRYLRGDGTWQTITSGGMTSFTLAGTTGTPQTITDGNTVTIAAGTGLTSTASATDTVTLAIDSTVATLTGTQTLTNKTLTTPTIASFVNAAHTHQDAAGGGTLDASAIASGTLDNARVNWASPGNLGSTTPAEVTATRLQADSSSQHYIDSSIGTGSTAAMVIRSANTAPVLDLRNPSGVYLRAIRDSDSVQLGGLSFGAVGGSANMFQVQGNQGVALGTTGGTFFLAARSVGTIVSNDVGSNSPNAPFHVRFTTLNNNTEHLVLRLSVVGNAAPSAGFGGRAELTLRSSSNPERQAGGIHWKWNDSTDATRKGELFFTAYDAATPVEGMRIRAISGATQIGFYGVTPVSRAAHIADPSGGAIVDSEARTAINAILVVLENLGLTLTS